MAVIEEVPLGDDGERDYYASHALLRDGPLERFACAGCGYGASRATAPDRCPMCGGATWDFESWRPFSGLWAEGDLG